METSPVEERLTRVEREFDELKHEVLSHDATLLTRNLADLKPVPGLRVEDRLD